MELVLKAIKSLFRKVDKGFSDLEQKIKKAQATAEEAQKKEIYIFDIEYNSEAKFSKSEYEKIITLYKQGVMIFANLGGTVESYIPINFVDSTGIYFLGASYYVFGDPRMYEIRIYNAFGTIYYTITRYNGLSGSVKIDNKEYDGHTTVDFTDTINAMIDVKIAEKLSE